MTITKEEILEAIRKAEEGRLERPPNTYTRQELGEIMGVGKHGIQSYIDRMIALGLCEKIEIRAINSKGRVIPVPGYVLQLNQSMIH